MDIVVSLAKVYGKCYPYFSYRILSDIATDTVMDIVISA